MTDLMSPERLAEIRQEHATQDRLMPTGTVLQWATRAHQHRGELLAALAQAEQGSEIWRKGLASAGEALAISNLELKEARAEIARLTAELNLYKPQTPIDTGSTR